MSININSDKPHTGNSHYLEHNERDAHQTDIDNKYYFRMLHCIHLLPHTPEEYYNSLKNQRDMEPFKEPPRKHFNHAAGISFPLILKAFFSETSKRELTKRKKLADALHQADTKDAFESYIKRKEQFYKSRQKDHQEVDALHERMKNGDVEQIEAYYTFVLQQDSFSTDFQNPFQINIGSMQYDRMNKSLSFFYRIPNTEEILTFSAFVYDQDHDVIVPKPAPQKCELLQRTHIMHRILLRALRMVYESDSYEFLDDVKITGFVEYFDSSYGKKRRKDVISFHMNREEFYDTNFEKVNVEKLFSARIRPKQSSNLYSRKEEDIFDIHSSKRNTISKKNAQ